MLASHDQKWQRLNIANVCVHQAQNDHNSIIIASSNLTRLSFYESELIRFILKKKYTSLHLVSAKMFVDWIMLFWYPDTAFIKLGSVLSRFDCV